MWKRLVDSSPEIKHSHECKDETFVSDLVLVAWTDSPGCFDTRIAYIEKDECGVVWKSKPFDMEEKEPQWWREIPMDFPTGE